MVDTNLRKRSCERRPPSAATKSFGSVSSHPIQPVLRLREKALALTSLSKTYTPLPTARTIAARRAHRVAGDRGGVCGEAEAWRREMLFTGRKADRRVGPKGGI